MIEGQGFYFDGRSSEAHPIRIQATEKLLRWEGDSTASAFFPLQRCTIAPALGKTRRRIRLPDQGLIETDDHRLVTQLEAWQGSNVGLRLVHALEQRWRTALLSLCGVALLTFLFITYGLPTLADRAARTIPLELTTPLTESTLAMLDEHLFGPSELPALDQARLQSLFADLHAQFAPNVDCTLVFREGEGVGANAFAFPNGLVVMTDELVELAENDRQLAGVMLHEMAHVIHRHSLRSTFQSAGVFVLISILTGDVTATTSLAASLPTVLLERGYSREFELEADAEAGRFMIAQGWGTNDYQSMLQQLTGDAGEEPTAAKYLSTHPLTHERIGQMRQLEQPQ